MNRNVPKIFLAIIALTLTLCPFAAFAEGAGRSVSGVVTYKGPKPAPAVLQMSRDEKCMKLHGDKPVLNEEQIVNDANQVKNVFVYVKDGLAPAKYPVPSEPANLDQEGCMYLPHVQGMRVEQKLNVNNKDGFLHNVRGLAKINPPLNLGQPINGTREKVFHKAETPIKFRCDVHPWMSAYIFVMPHPFFAVTDDQGKFTIKDLPPGDYTLTAWHEKYGERELKIKVADKDMPHANFVVEAPTK
jgi:hypothetical protein